jgi:8-oxo-dGTP pyrophosphatase MutT (NUDIX family)
MFLLNVVECIIRHKNHFLLIQRPDYGHAANLLAFPGGKLDQGDLIENHDILQIAAIREVLEEVGINLVNPLHYVTTNYFKDDNGTQVIDTIFLCALDENEDRPQVQASSREVANYYWMTFEEIKNHKNTPPWLLYYLSKANTVNSR